MDLIKSVYLPSTSSFQLDDSTSTSNFQLDDSTSTSNFQLDDKIIKELKILEDKKNYGLHFQALKLLNSATVWQKKISKREWEAYEAPKGCEVSKMVKLYTTDLIEELKNLKNVENEIDYLKKKEENIKDKNE